jgi:hypothetical protein
MFAMSLRTYLEASVEAEIEKKCAFIDDATALARTVFPFPGGPKNSIPKKEISCVILPISQFSRTFWWRTNSGEEIRSEQWIHDCFLQRTLGIIETD